MSSRQALIAVAVAACLAAASPQGGSATSYDPFTPDLEACARRMTAGEAVFLFLGGTEEARAAVRVGDVLSLPVRGPAGEGRVRGSIRIVSFEGKSCLRGEVVEGLVRVLERLEKDGAYFLVVPEGVCPP